MRTTFQRDSLRTAERRSGLSPRRADDRHPFEVASMAAFEIWRRAYRWSRLNIRVDERLGRLKAELGPLPRLGLGTRLIDLDPELDVKLAPLREPGRELVIADFDQNGGVLPRHGKIRGVPSIDASQFMPRIGCAVLLVDLGGHLGVRKEFGDETGRFVQEIEALVHLSSRGCAVPELMNVDWGAHSITSTFIPGDVVRELLASAGADIRDRPSKQPYTRSEDKERIRLGREFVDKIMSERQIGDLAAALSAVHRAGFALEDVKYGNIILRSGSKEPVFVDLERALPLATLPGRLAAYLEKIDLRKFRDQFGAIDVTGQEEQQGQQPLEAARIGKRA